jgi:hypothetical protein
MTYKPLSRHRGVTLKSVFETLRGAGHSVFAARALIGDMLESVGTEVDPPLSAVSQSRLTPNHTLVIQTADGVRDPAEVFVRSFGSFSGGDQPMSVPFHRPHPTATAATPTLSPEQFPHSEARTDLAVEKAGKHKSDKAGALAEISDRVAKGQKKRAVCIEVYGKYGYPTWLALERAYDRSVRPAEKRANNDGRRNRPTDNRQTE